MKLKMQRAIFGPRTMRPARGFTLVELVISMAVLMIGIAAVAQLVPLATRTNMNNRQDTTAVVLAERLMNQMVNQPLTATQFTDVDGRVILLGNLGASGLTGNPIIVVASKPLTANFDLVRVDFTANAVPNYNFIYVNPNDANQTVYEVRWSVITRVAGPTVVSKRFLVGVWRRDPRGVTVPVTVDGWVQR
jgi:prepilin-type N-terminal cleavage/methylation domain-containing protein